LCQNPIRKLSDFMTDDVELDARNHENL
jgi:hypothetical protein